MGFDIDSLVGKTAETKVEFAGEFALVSYDPTLLTQNLIVEAERSDTKFLDFFCRMITEWDVTQGGKTVPIEVEALGAIPMVFLRAVFMHILRENSAGELGKLSSSGSSRRKAPQDRRPRRSTATSKSQGSFE